MPSENHRPTQEDVAREAGVSRAVVSYVINNRSGGKVRISEPTRRRVLEVVQRLGDRSSTYVFTLVFEKGRWHIHNPRSTTPQGS